MPPYLLQSRVQIFEKKAQLPMGMGEEARYRECFRNAQREYYDPRWSYLGLKYCEGMVVLSNGDIVFHAWLIDRATQVLEVTPFRGVFTLVYVGAVLECPASDPALWSCVVPEDVMAETVRPVLLPLLYERNPSCLVDWEL